MCGIVGYSGNREAAPIVLEGLQQLEYRGYDSAGIAVINEEGQIERHRAVGKLSNLLLTIGDLPGDGMTSGAITTSPSIKSTTSACSSGRKFSWGYPSPSSGARELAVSHSCF